MTRVDSDDSWRRIEGLRLELLECRSATAALEAFCARDRVSPPCAIKARLLEAGSRPATRDQRRRLGARADETIAYRKVHLVHGGIVLCEASNWYLPARLTHAMNERLAETDIPFGRAVADLEPFRQTIASQSFWEPGHPAPPVLFDHRALLLTESGQAFAEVEEHYGAGLLSFVRQPPAS
ncbi:MAG: hypothetical protein P4L76_13645 [Beijerinckiaceae bacterium]|nr:hypothetical protein [Beijerinckiaceae bacterium]